ALQLEDLGTVNEARAGEGHELRLRLAPPVERCRPFAGAVLRPALLAGRDDAAVDEPRDDGREPAARDRHHRLVEKREALREPGHPDQRAPREAPSEGDEVAVVASLTDRGGLGGGIPRAFEISRGGEAADEG